MNRSYRCGKLAFIKGLSLAAILLTLACLQARAGSTTPSSVPAQATFVNVDTKTQGNWRGVYGADGYSVAGDLQSIPSYALFGVQNATSSVWDPYPTAVTALQRASNYSRIAANWYSQTLYFDANFTDGNPHQFALYAIDYDNKGRQEIVQIVDADSGAALDARSLTNFTNGEYLVWNISGHVRIYVKTLAGPNAVVSGAFFGGAPSGGLSDVLISPPQISLAAGQNQQFSASVLSNPNQPVTWSISPSLGSISATGYYTSPISITLPETVTVTATNTANPSDVGIATVTLMPGATANFITTDTTSQGNWAIDYGFDGTSMAGATPTVPPYAALSLDRALFTWNSNTTDPRALVTGAGGTRSAVTWYDTRTLQFTVNFTDHNSHEFAIYALDWDNQGRSETVEILDANTKAVLDTRFISDFQNGIYLAWTLSGDVMVQITGNSGPNAVVSGVFFGGGDPPPPPAVATFVGADAATQGNWIGVRGSDGYAIASYSENIPVYATFSVSNQQDFIWTNTTNDPRALELGIGSSRIASAWYSQHFSSPPSFSFNVNFLDGATHQLALYALDWDAQSRSEQIQIVDANTNAILDTRNISNFSTGIYMIWNISGSVIINVISTAGPNSVMSGVFFDATQSVSVSVNPQSVTLPVGQKQQFTAAVTGSSNQGVTWSISPSNMGSITQTGVYTAPGIVTSSQPVTVTATSQASSSSFGSSTVNFTTSSAAFVNYDTTTEGNWHGAYGKDGYSVVNDSQSIPSYASFSVVGPNGEWTWAQTTSDPRALQTGNNASRIAACWYKNHESFTFNIAFNDGLTHQVALYALDWDQEGRFENIQVLDATTSALLDSRTISNFQNGMYVIYNITGSVVINVAVEGGGNAVISGVFFGGAGSVGSPESVTVNPSSMNLSANGTQQFTATVTNGTGTPTWSISNVSPSGAAQGALSSTGFYTAPSSVTAATTITIKATAADGLAAGTATVNLTPTITSSSTAVFVSPMDTTTEGSWKGKYGADGYELPNPAASLPAYATFAVQNASAYTWNASTTDTRALQAPGGGRVAATWYNPVSFNINVGFTDGNTHQVALYALDWDSVGRAETIQITDIASGAVLDSRNISSFSNGVYLVWNISGNVKFTITATSSNAVVSGIFFEPTTGGGGGTETVGVNPGSVSLNASGTQQFNATVTNGTGTPTWSITNVNPSGAAQGTVSGAGFYTAPSSVTVSTTVTITATAADGLASGTATVTLTPTVTGGNSTAVFVSPTDTTTEGNWQGKYGADGYEIANSGASLPAYATFAVQNATGYTWNGSTSDTRALQLPGGGRIASTWFNPTAFNINVSFTDGGTHQVALYALDWDNIGRAETIQITDAVSGAVLDTRNISSFGNGVYLLWNISGSVKFTITSTAGNAVIGGVFFEPQSSGSGGAESVSVTPSPVTLNQSATQQFNATVTNGTGTPTWTVSNVNPSGAAQGTLSSTGFYTAPSTITVTTTVTIKATAADGLASGTATVTLNPPASSGGATAVFVAPMDATTQGNWIGKYGAKGYEIANVFPSLPAFANFTVNGNAYTWNGNPSDVRALDQPGGTSRIASTWFSPVAFNIGVNITDSNTHQVALYALDWDNIGRVETIQVTDAVSGTVLDSRTISSFSGGVYLVWNISGNVIFTITPTSQNAVISGVFFDN